MRKYAGKPKKCRLVIGVGVLAISAAACGAPLDGDTTCGDFLQANVADREDIVDGALNQRGVEHDQMFDLTVVSMQVASACGRTTDKGTPVKNVMD